jgi:1,2-dihydroxy-3-keto-5-methylthiopentene dioxygenase
MKATWLDQGTALSTQELLAHDVYYERLATQPEAYQAPLDTLKGERGYVQQDEVALSPQTPNIDAICAKFVDEHLHDDDEVRFVLEGAGIFDIRSRDDRYMRVEVGPGDLIVVPARTVTTASCSRRARPSAACASSRTQSGWVPRYRAEQG